jgi:two-component system response regulator PilR (NtrC family)
VGGLPKELAAREIHAQSSRSEQAFIAVNCGAIPEALMEAEFFGYRKGAFTGAIGDRDGFFQAANGGTLLLDEVAELPLAMQVKLLRAIQERRVRKIGATVEEPVDVRIISATHQNLEQCVAVGKFRQDLFYRLNVIELVLPALRERLDDLDVLIEAILERLSMGGHKARLGPQVLDTLRSYSFPGNVRELENILERALAFADDGVIEVANLALKGASLVVAPDAPDAPDAPNAPVTAVTAVASVVTQLSQPEMAANALQATPPAALPATLSDALPHCLPDYLNQVERDIILRALVQTRFNRTQAAQLLGISVRQLRYQMQRLAIHAPEPG